MSVVQAVSCCMSKSCHVRSWLAEPACQTLRLRSAVDYICMTGYFSQFGTCIAELWNVYQSHHVFNHILCFQILAL